jgi:hypothetical protein
MALNILFRNDNLNRIENLVFDATLSEAHEGKSQVTNYSVEDGSQISDHIINQPDKLVIEGFVTNSSLSGGGATASQQAFNQLFQLRSEKKLVTVVTGFKVYNDMAILSISVPKTRATGDSISFTVELQKITKVGSSSVTSFASSIAGAFAASAMSRLNLGRVVSQVAGNLAQTVATNLVRRLF